MDIEDVNVEDHVEKYIISELNFKQNLIDEYKMDKKIFGSIIYDNSNLFKLILKTLDDNHYNDIIWINDSKVNENIFRNQSIGFFKSQISDIPIVTFN